MSLISIGLHNRLASLRILLCASLALCAVTEKELRKNKNIVILQPDKGNGVVILDRQEYDKGLFKIINDTTKFRVLTSDPTLTREGKLQRYLRELRKKRSL